MEKIKMVKEDKKDVIIPCYGNMRGCLVGHCDIAQSCYELTLGEERIIAFKNIKGD
jgi:hypothetical protein